MNNERLKINYLAVLPSDWGEIRRDLKLFENQSIDYEWKTPEPPNPYRRGLVTLIKLDRISRRSCMGYLRQRREQGKLEHLMFDSGGFQMFRDPSYTIERLLKENLRLYKEYDWADSYVMPDIPPLPTEPRDRMLNKVERTINATQTLFSQLPEHVQRKSVPVFHVRNEGDLDYQYEQYKEIIAVSGKTCYAIPGSRKKLDLKNMRLMKYLVGLLPPGTKVHALGVASPAAVYCMEQIGITSYDAVSPIFVAGLGMVQFFGPTMDFSDRRNGTNASIEELNKARELTGHRCPFCDNPDLLFTKYRFRRLHNLIIFDEFDWHFRNTTPDEFQNRYPNMSRWLAETLEIEDAQMTLF